jgi:hypothetical protein
MGVLDHPDAERPYLILAEAYGDAGLFEEKKAVLFLVEKRFGATNDCHTNPHEKQRKDNSQDS